MVRVEPEKASQVKFYHKFMVGYLYFIQGVFLNMPSTITLTYKQIPSYDILGYFSLVTIPFSLKFLSAPLIEKYTSVKYGRRKTWLVISLMLASILLLFSINYTAEQHQIFLALIFLFITLCVSIEDICTDGLAIKQLNNSQLASYLQLVYQLIGGVFGNLVFLELTSSSLAQRLGYQQPIISVGQFIMITAGITFISGIIIHFTYTQTVLKEQQQVSHTLFEVVLHYKHFVNPNYRLCRAAVANLTINHGLHYFGSIYMVQLLKHGHVSKQIVTTVSNFMIIPLLIITHFVSKYFSEVQYAYKRMRIMIGIRLTIMLVLFIGDITELKLALLGIVLLSLCSNIQFFFSSLIVNSVADSKFAGMYVTMMASSANFGNNTAIHMQMINKFGISACSIGGFVYTIGIIGSFGRLEKWIMNGAQEKDFGGQALIKKQK